MLNLNTFHTHVGLVSGNVCINMTANMCRLITFLKSILFGAKKKVWIVQKGNNIFKLMTKEINVYIEENNINTCIYIYTELAHMQDKGIDKIDGLKLYRKQNNTHTYIYIKK